MVFRKGFQYESFGENGISTISTTTWGALISYFEFDSQGNIIVAGRSNLNIAIGKTNSNGIIDRDFGDNGIVRVSMLQFFGENELGLFDIFGLKIIEGNKILLILKYVPGDVIGENIRKILLMQFNENGNIDEDFGTDGKIFIDVNGHYVINTENNDYMLLANGLCISKYSYSGDIDEYFGENGIVYLTNNEDFRIVPLHIKLLNDQSIIIVGYNEQKLAFLKLTPDGNFAADFANNGSYIMEIDNYLNKEKYFNNVIEDNERNLVFTGKLADSLIVCSFNPHCSPQLVFILLSRLYATLFSYLRTTDFFLTKGASFIFRTA